MRSRRTAALVAALALAFPAAALADSAGDNQYQDPLANSPSKPQKKKTTTTTPSAPATAPATTSPAPSSSSSSSSSASSAASQSSGTLPRTGLPLAPLAAGGLALIGAGLLIRRLA
jgi:hypothetical protein